MTKATPSSACPSLDDARCGQSVKAATTTPSTSVWANARRVTFLSVVVVVAAATGVGCAPFAAEDESCKSRPCAAGLQCFESICVRPTEPRIPEPDCIDDDQCSLNGSADGRACVEGECVYIDCVLDAQCGTRICDQGTCVDNFPCNDNEDCREGTTCQDSVCRSPCENDADCSALPFNVCQDGTCRQQCLGDFTCFGDICEDGVCLSPGCEEDIDCEGENVACNDGRCESFTPCEVDDDCFDPDFLCNDINRCEERALCRTDDECGLSALCVQDHCRPATPCASDAACDDGDECVAGRCVSALECRADDECGGGEVCERGVCSDRPDDVASTVVAASVHSDCTSTATCALTLFIGESTELRSMGLDDEGIPLSTQHAASSSDTGVATVSDESAGLHTITATGAGTTTVSLAASSGAATLEAATVTVLPATTDAVRVLVIDAETGRAIESATVTVGAETALTGVDGVAGFATAPAPNGEPFVGAIAPAYVGHVVVGLVPTGDLRLALTPDVAAANAEAAGIRAKVISSGDELGPVGIGIFLPAVPRAEEARIDRLFGETFNGSVEIPVLGEVPIPLRGALSLEASIPIIGAQNVKDTSFAVLESGIAGGLALEGRFEQANLFDFVLGADDIGVVLNIAQVGESLDAQALALGDVEALPLVEDGDTSDGVADIDNDGDITERLPDWLAFEERELSPTRSPRERVGVKAVDLPADARARTLAIGGVSLPALGFLPLGLAAPTIAAADGPASQMRVVAPEGGLARGDRHIVLQAIFDDVTLSSALYSRGRAFSANVDLGGFISPPAGAFFVDGVPSVGDRLLVLPQVENSTTFDAEVTVGNVRWHAVVNAAASGGRSFALPPMLLAGPSSVGRVSALRLPGVSSSLATTEPYRAGAGPSRSLRDGAAAVATSDAP